MKTNEKSNGMIGFRPSLLESMKISYIGATFHLNRGEVLRELMNGEWTLDKLHAIAHKTSSEQHGATLPYLRKAYNPKKSINKIVKDGNRMYTKNTLGIVETEKSTICEFAPDKNIIEEFKF
jgi:hypothetical protein